MNPPEADEQGPSDGAASEPPVGRVLRGDARAFDVLLDGRVVRAAPRGRLFEELGDLKNPVAVGDLVQLSPDGDPMGIDAVLPRTNSLSKVSSSHDPRRQVLFANVDQVVVVNSLGKPGFSSNRTDRILAACEFEDIPAIVLINKLDLDRGGEADGIRATYERAGFEVLGTSATDGTGLEELRVRLSGRVSVLYGASGVGKSTLLNALYGLELEIGKISKYWSSGKHTTTFSRWIPVDDEGTVVVDTPGIRTFRPWGVNKRQLRHLYQDFEPYNARCRFPDCSHDHEPDCAVVDAVEAGALAASRYLSYVEILDELEPPPEEIETISGE
ncbi:MAG: ribosome small subunit-dependent GTPase A [Planctomycetota bacterium]